SHPFYTRLNQRLAEHREAVCEASETAHPHSHRQIVTLNKTGADVLGIRITADNLLVSADALGRTITAHLGIRRCAVYLLQLCIFNVSAKRIFDCLKISFVTIRRDLHTALDAPSAVLHEVFRPSAVPSAD